jgi:hypothetical protein
MVMVASSFPRGPAVVQRTMATTAAFAAIRELGRRQTSSPSAPVTLDSLQDNPGARVRKTRVGRGPGSKLGKSAGRGMCGQRAREGGSRSNIFTGGQMPLHRSMPLIGFKNPYVAVTHAREPSPHALLHVHRCAFADTTHIYIHRIGVV